MKKKDILFILISGSVLILAWIIFNIYHNSKSTTISETTNIQIAPIDPSFNTKTIEEIKKRKNIQPIYENKKNQNLTSTNSASAILLPSITESPSPTINIQNPITPTGIQTP